MNWNLTANSHSTSPKGKKENKLKERERRGEKTRTQSVKGIRDYYPNETDVIRDSEEIAQLCQCRETRGLWGEIKTNCWGTSTFLLRNYLMKHYSMPRSKWKQLTANHHITVWSISHVATRKAVTVFVIFSLLSWTLAAPILTSHTLSD